MVGETERESKRETRRSNTDSEKSRVCDAVEVNGKSGGTSKERQKSLNV